MIRTWEELLSALFALTLAIAFAGSIILVVMVLVAVARWLF
jgi:hypothetical protein